MIKDIFPNNQIRTVAKMANKLYLGGNFSGMNGQTRRALASIDLSNGELTNFNPVFDSLVSSIVAGSTRLGIVGRFNSVTYNGQVLNNCNGIVFYDTISDSFSKLDSLVPTPDSRTVPGGSWQQGSYLNKIVYHQSGSNFYICGNFLMSFTDYLGNQVVNATCVLSVKESDLSLYDMGIKYQQTEIYQPPVTVGAPGGVNPLGLYYQFSIADMAIDEVGNRIFLAQLWTSPSNPSMAWNIADPHNVIDLNWKPYMNSTVANIIYADNKIWMTGGYLSRYDPQFIFGNIGQSYGNGRMIVVDPNSSFNATSPSAADPSLSFGVATTNPLGSFAVYKAYDDGANLFFMGAFSAMGVDSNIYNAPKKNTSFAKFLKSSYTQTINENLNLQYWEYWYYTNGLNSSISSPYIYDLFVDDGKMYLFGFILFDGGSRRGKLPVGGPPSPLNQPPWKFGLNPYVPYVLNADGSKLQKSYLGVV